MRIAIIVDKPNSAIDILSRYIQDDLKHHKIYILYLHPKRPSAEQIELLKTALKADVVHFQYWKSAIKSIELLPALAEKRTMLTHHNPYDLEQEQWTKYFNIVVVKNNYQKEVLPYAHLVPHTINQSFFRFTRKQFNDIKIGMVASRIESTKGILEVAKACRLTDTPFILVGRISDRNYFNQILEVNPDIDFRENITHQQLLDFYQEITLLVVNSKDGFESGTLPTLEAMAAGVPVMARPVGLIEDIYNGKNLHLVERQKENIQGLVDDIIWLKNTPGQLKKYSEEGYQSVKNRLSKYSSYQYEQLYYKLYNSNPLISVIIPTKNRPDSITQILDSITKQTYKNIEVVVVDSSDNISTEFRLQPYKNKLTLKYIHFQTLDPEYNLAKARNMGILHSVGKYCLFLDDRLALEKTAVQELVTQVSALPEKLWVWGVKDNFEKSFVENFSIVRRKDIVTMGMFCERMNVYGGMTQEIRTRAELNGFKLERCNTAHARSISKGTGWKNKPKDLITAKLYNYMLHKL